MTNQDSTTAPESTTSTRESDTPLADALVAAREALEAAEAAFDAWEPEDGHADADETVECDRLGLLVTEAEAAVEAALAAFNASDEECEWALIEEGHEYGTCRAATAAEALEEARSNVDRSNYSDATGTIWIDVRVRCELTGEEDSATVTLDEDEPDCPEGEHDWQSPYDLLGGLKENPGVSGHGGGVIVQEVCMRCGCGKTTDTWAQNPSDGTQGHTSVEYEPGKYADEIPTREERALEPEISCAELRVCAAYVAASIRGDETAMTLERPCVTHDGRVRARDVGAYVSRVYAAVPRKHESRAVRLALWLAARDQREADAAMAIHALVFGAQS